MSQSRYNYSSPANNWGYPLYLCDCCPYGYHIDLDFVRYCESISKDADRTGSIKRRRDRRRQRKSMEVLLGLDSITDHYEKQQEPISPIIETENRLLQKQDSFDNVIDDFEKTYEISNNKLSNNLPDVTAVSDNRSPILKETRTALSGRLVLKKVPHRELGSPHEFCALTPKAFKTIREQMAQSLERTRQLEEQVKQLPILKVELLNLKDENEKLLRKIDQLKQTNDQTSTSNKKCSTLDPYFNRRNRSNSFSCTDDQYQSKLVKKCLTPSHKDIGVSCSVLTRNVGVGNLTPSRKHVSTATEQEDSGYADKWFGEKLKFINDQNENTRKSLTKIPMISKANQTFVVNAYNQETQTVPIVPPKKITSDKHIQTSHKAVDKKDQGIVVKPRTLDFGMQKSVESYNVGVSDDSITDINCDKCNVVKMTVAVGPDQKEEQHVLPVSLASLSVPRSKSFNLGEDKMNSTKRKRSVSIQYQYVPESSNKSSQCEPSNVSRSCQTSIKTHSKGTQYEPKVSDSSTQFDTTFLVSCTPKKNKSIGTEEQMFDTKSASEATATIVCTECQKEWKEDEETPKKETRTGDNAKMDEKKKEDSKKKDGVVVSRIPKPQLTPTSERRNKFRRQDTYTKINASPPPEENDTELSGLDLSKSSTTSITTFERVKENLKFPDTSSEAQSHNEINHHSITNLCKSETEPIATTPLLVSTTSKQRKKAMPSKEMQGAMKVLNDSLEKQKKPPKNHRAIDIIQQEWFRISGVVKANPLDVEDYLDAFEDMSSMLLNCIVNMTDASGNTAMHYAVSHGNFDVVSILLDSKVCDINKPNKAGYTSVMLVSLADIRSPTHANVVRRLFQMADVNRRAKQHGQTALMLAVSHGKLDMVKMLLEAGADINIQDDDGSTALMCAAEHGHIEIVKHFLSQPDCDSTITDVDGSTALKIAMEAEHRPIGVLLYAHERNLMGTHGHRHRKKSPSSPLPIRHSYSALNDIKSSK